MVFDDNNLDTELWSSVRTVIVDGLSSDSVTASVVASYSGKVNTKPVVVIEPIDESFINNKFGSSHGRSDLVVNVDIFCNTNTYDLDVVSNSVKKSVKADSLSGVSFKSMTSSYDFQSVNDVPFHNKHFSFSYVYE